MPPETNWVECYIFDSVNGEGGEKIIGPRCPAAKC